MQRLFLSLCLLYLSGLILPVYADLPEVSVTNPIDAAKNAKWHNTKGVNYYKDGDYYAALKEFKMAVELSPYSQASAVYYNNLGKVYLIFGMIQKGQNLTTKGGDFSKMATLAFEEAILKDCMKFEYYKNLAEAYELMGIASQKKDFLIRNINTNPFNGILAGIILVNEGKTKEGARFLYNFALNNSDLIITDDVKKFLKTTGIYDTSL